MSNVSHRPRHVLPSGCYLGRSRKYSLAWGSSLRLDFESSPPGPNFGLHSAVLEVKGGLSQLPDALLSLQLRILLRNLQPKTNPFISCPGQVICHSNRERRDPTRAESGGAFIAKHVPHRIRMAAPMPVSHLLPSSFHTPKQSFTSQWIKQHSYWERSRYMFFLGISPCFQGPIALGPNHFSGWAEQFGLEDSWLDK